MNIIVGENFTVLPQANDADGDSLTFSILNKPTWTSFDTGTGSLSGQPGATDVGSYSGIVISVTDGIDTTNGNAFEIIVDPESAPITNTPPTLSGTPPTSVKSGERYSFLPVASDPDGDTLVFSIDNQPIWAQFNDQTGELSGNPGVEHVGSYNNIRVGVGDGSTWVYTATFSIQVTTDAPPVQPPPAQNRAPIISGNPVSSVVTGEAYSYTPTASDPDGDALTFSIRRRPAWASFDTRSGTLSGTPSQDQAGTYSGIQISVSDGQLTTNGVSFSIQVVAANRAPTLTGSPSPSVNAGDVYTYQPTASDADGDTLSFTVANLPSWASFNSTTGQISGRPAQADVGIYSNIRISVSDGSVTTNGQAFSIEVTQVSLGKVTLSWTAPTENIDGTPLTDLAGYKLYYGTSQGNYPEQITIDNPGILTYVVENLAPNTYYFVITAYNDAMGREPVFRGRSESGELITLTTVEPNQGRPGSSDSCYRR